MTQRTIKMSNAYDKKDLKLLSYLRRNTNSSLPAISYMKDVYVLLQKILTV